MSRLIRLAIAAIGLCLAGAPMLAAAQPAPAVATSQLYVLGPEDELHVAVLGRQDFDLKPKVQQDGTIQLPYIGSVKAAGLNVDQLSEEIRRRLQDGGYFNKPVMSVSIESYASRYVTVLGEVNHPGLVPVDRAYHLSDILARVDGVTAAGADYVLLTTPDGTQHRLPIASIATGGAGDDPLVSPGDKIYSPKADMFYISGQVKQPGTYPITNELTIRMAIARGGGLTDLGSDKGVKVTHKDAKKPVKESLEEKVQAGDVIVVGERLF